MNDLIIFSKLQNNINLSSIIHTYADLFDYISIKQHYHVLANRLKSILIQIYTFL